MEKTILLHCQDPGCGKEFVWHSTKKRFCSDCVKRHSYEPLLASRQGSLPVLNHLQPAIRWCLVCNKPFQSQGPWNRKCPGCSEHVEYGRLAVRISAPC